MVLLAGVRSLLRSQAPVDLVVVQGRGACAAGAATPDLGGMLTTAQMTDRILAHLAAAG